MKFRTAKPIGFEDTDSAGSFLGDGEQTSSSSSFAPLCVVFEGPDNFSHAPNYVSTGGINAEGGDSFPQVFATSGDLSAAAGSKPVATIPQLANYLINGFWQYQGTISHHWALGTTITYNVNGLTTAEKFLAQSALVAWSDIANVTFVQTSGSAKITFNHNGTMTAFESDNYSNGGITSSATIDISADWITTDGGANDGKTGIDSYGYQTYIHEIGHALGLGHQGPYNGSASYSSGALYANDTWQYSVMSYFSESNYSGSSYRYVITPQMADIYAVQSIYGAGSGRAGNTTYGFHNTAGSIYDFTAYSQAPAFTIYDSSGTDTLDCSGYSVAQTIDLHAGSFSSIGGLINNIGIALSCTIEIAIGGSASDVIFANDSGSTLYGGSGDDDLTGGAGNDTLVGGTGNDTVDGGGGTDSVIFGGSRAGYIITGLSGGAVRVTGPDGTDTLVSVELLVFSDQTVNLGVSIDLTPPSIVSISTSGSAITGGSGILNTGKVVTLTVSMSEAVTVAGGTPTLSLNNGGTATYVSGSGTGALIFSYTVMAGQSINDLSVTTFNSNGATLKDTANNAADLSAATNYNPAGVLQIDTLAPTVASISTSGIGITAGSGNLNVGKVITLTVAMSETVMVAGTPTLSLNDGGNAAYVSGSGTGTLIFNHTVLPGQSTADLTVTSLNLGGATLRDAAGNAADLSGAANYNPAGVLKIDGLIPTISSISTFGTSITNGNGSLNAGKVVTVTVNLSEAATLVGGTPTLSLNDGGNAAYVSGSGTDTLTFSHIVMSGQSTADLAVTAFNLNGASLRDSSNNDADLSGATNYNPAGLLVVDTSAPTLASVTTSGSGIVGGNGIVNTSSVVTLTVAMSEIVTVSGGTPTLSLNNGGVATYVSGSGTGPLIFGYTVAPGQSANDLIVTTFNLNGATINDAAGNAANLSAAAGYNPAGVLVIDTLVPTVVSISTSGNGITNGNGNINAGKVVTLAVAMSEAVTVTGGTPTLSLDDGGLASYVSGSGTDTLIFHHTATAGQSTTDLTVTAFNLNGAAVKDGAGNGANLSGAANYNPMGVLQIDTAGPAVLSLFATTDTQASTIASGHSVTVSIVSNETVTVTGSPILQLNDNEVATFTGGSGTNILTFSYVVVPTDNTPDLRVTGLSFPSGATISDSSGNSFGAVAGDLGIAVHGQLQPADVVEEINGLYIALYSVAATKAGVQFWINAAHSVDPSITPANASITAISPSVSVYLGQQFVQTQSTYFNSLYGSLDDTQFVKALYQNLTSSSGSNSGVQYWVDLLQSAEASSHDLLNSRAGIAAQFVHDVISIDLTPGASAFGLTGQEYTALVAGQQAMLNKLAVAQYYANQSGTTVGDILNYTSTTGPTFAAAHDVLSDVTNNTSTVIAAIVGINNAVAHQDIGFI